MLDQFRQRYSPSQASRVRQARSHEVVLLSGWSADECLAVIRELHVRGLIRVTASQGLVHFSVLNLIQLAYREGETFLHPMGAPQSLEGNVQIVLSSIFPRVNS